MPMDEFIALVNKLGGASFATLLLLILYGSWKNIWVWSRDVAKVTERYEALLHHEIEEKEFWRNIALRVTGIAEASAVLVKKTIEKP